MSKTPKEPALNQTSFRCPHCGTFTTQYWFKAHADKLEKNKTPELYEPANLRKMMNDPPMPAEAKASFLKWIETLETGKLFREHSSKGEYVYDTILELFFSECYTCEKIAVWHRDRLIYPSLMEGDEPNADFPVDIVRDYEEARTILTLSPRGAAALLRLCVQKICVALGEKDKKLDDAIASMVKKGLDPHVQHSLDSVRVIGNEAVHPGQMDMSDNRETALELFGAINLIVAQMISNPKKARALYAKIPESKRAAIEARDLKGKKDSKDGA